MREEFKHFINQIPSEEISRAKIETYPTANIIIFRPTAFLIGMETYIKDYHFALPVCTPPPMRIGKREYQCGKGRITMFEPETIVTCTTFAPTTEYIAMSIKREFFHEVADSAFGKISLGKSGGVNPPYSSKLISLINYFGEELETYHDSCELMLQSISMQITIQLIREMGCDDQSGNKKLIDSYNYTKIAEEFIRTHYNSNIKIEDICKYIHVSPYYLIHLFKDQMGQTPHEFLITVRLEKAEEMLKKGNYTVEEVALDCGFSDSAHFSKAFKRAKGIPPSRYKKEYYIIDGILNS